MQQPRPVGGRPAGKTRDDERRTRPDKPERTNQRPQREERKVAFDPDSPFAALAALRGKSE